jgi:hypothetical protein
MWDLWWAKWHWDRFYSKFFGFSLSVSSFHKGSILIYVIIIWRKNKRSVSGRRSEVASPHRQNEKAKTLGHRIVGPVTNSGPQALG